MNARYAAACAALLTSLAAHAAHAAAPVTASLQSPVEGRVRQVAGGAVFSCENAVCTAGTPGTITLTVRGCRELAQAVGPVTAFGSDKKKLSDAKLIDCNKWAAKGSASVSAQSAAAN